MKRFLITLLCLLLICVSALADTVYILCQPDSWVNVREFPNKTANICGRLELGQEVETDGVIRKGYLHLIGTGFEGGDTWLKAGFATEYPVTIMTIKTQINSRGRVACRRSIKGNRRKWLKDGAEVTIYAYSEEWSITDQGFIKTQFLGVL